MVIPVLMLARLAIPLAGWASLGNFATPAADSAAVASAYGIHGFANSASSVGLAVQDSAVRFQASRIASNATEGYTARVGFDVPVSKDGAEHDLTGLTQVSFRYRNDKKITDMLLVQLVSSAYPVGLQEQDLVYGGWITGASALAAGTSWKQAVIDVYDFATPAWWTDVPVDFPTIEDALKHVSALRFIPQTTYSASGSLNGTACAKCVSPTMTSQTLDLRELRLVGGAFDVLLPMASGSRLRVDCDATPFDVAANGTGYAPWNDPLARHYFDADSVAAQATLGVCAGSNPGSDVAVSFYDSAVRLRVERLANDGREGYSAQAYLIHSIVPGGAVTDLSGLEAIAFDFRNDAKITDALTVQLISTAYSNSQIQGGLVYQYEIRGATLLAASTGWKHVELSTLDFATPAWWTDIPADYPTLETVLKSVTALRIQPNTTYASSGTNQGQPCTKCVEPTMPSVTLDVRDIILRTTLQPPPPEPTRIRSRLDCDASPFTLAPAPGEPSGGSWLRGFGTYAADAPDSTSALATYGICAGANAASTVDVAVVRDSFVRLETRLGSDGNEGYSAQAYLVHPLAKDGRTRDLRGVETIRFSFRNSAKITDALAIQLVSPAYSDGQMDSGLVYEVVVSGSSALAAGNGWKSVELSVLDFATPSWWADLPNDYPTLDAVLSKVKAIRIQPRSTYSANGMYGDLPCTRCVAPTMTALALDIRGLRLEGSGLFEPPQPDTVACSGAHLAVDSLLDDFENDLGEPWYHYTDNDSATAREPGASGSSHARQILSRGAAIELEARLDRVVGGVRQPAAGWAGLGTNLPSRDFSTSSLKGIGFRILPTSAIPDGIDGVELLVLRKGETDATARRVALPRRYLEGGANDFCVRPQDLLPADAEDTTAFAPASIAQLHWRIALAEDAPADTALAGFRIEDLKLYGAALSDDPSVRTNRRVSGEFLASYAGGTLSLRGHEGFDRIEIRAIDGRRVASFAPVDRFPIALARGTWFVVALKDGRAQVRPLVAAGR